MESWEVTLDLGGKWHCYQAFSVEESSRVMTFTNLRAIKRQAKWAIEAPSRSQALTIAKNDWKRREKVKEQQININPALLSLRPSSPSSLVAIKTPQAQRAP